MLNLMKNPVTSAQYLWAIILCLCNICVADDTIKIIGPEQAQVQQPVQFTAIGLPDKCTQVWKISPRSDSDVWMEMYDRNGTPINIYWSLATGLKTIDLIVAVNGAEVPVITTAEHSFQYGGSPTPPGPDPPVPVPGPPTPSVELQQAVAPLVAYRIKINADDRENLIDFYGDFAKVLAASADTVTTNTNLRDAYMKAGVLFFEGTGIKGKYAGLPEIIDGILADRLGLEISDIDVTEAAAIFQAVSWAFWKGGK